METNENSRIAKLIKKLPEGAIDIFESWYDPDFEILEDYIDLISETVCFLVLEKERDYFKDPGLNARIIRLSHLYDNLKRIQVE